MPKVTVILPTRDRQLLLPRAVDSVLRQTLVDLELLVIDNNRAEPPVDSSQWGADSRVFVIRAPDCKNAASARNVGLERARGEWVAYLDDDDAFRPEKLERQMADAGGFPLVLCGAQFHTRGRKRTVQASARSIEGDDLLNLACWGAPLLMHRRESTLRFNERLNAGEDLYFGQSALNRFRAKSVPVCPIPLVDVYQDRDDSLRTNTRTLDIWRASSAVLNDFGANFSRKGRRLFTARALMARLKLEGKPGKCILLTNKLLRLGGIGQFRYAANAIAVASGIFPGRWVT